MSDTPKRIKNGAFGILERDGKVLMGLRNPSDSSFPNCWCHPGGGIEYSESIDSAIEREFVEEVLLDVNVSQDYLAVHEYFEKGRHVILMFKQVLSDKDPIAGDGFTQLGWFSIEQIRELHSMGRTTPLTIVAAESWHCRERENNQLRADLKQCAEALKENRITVSHSGAGHVCVGCGEPFQHPHKDYCLINKALSLPAVQNALEDR